MSEENKELTANQVAEILPKLTSNQMVQIVQNAQLVRRELLQKMLDEKHDIDQECGYPQTISDEDYANMYAREGVGARLVDVWPEETWKENPIICETEDGDDETEFEKAWKEVEETRHCLHYLFRSDKLSGVGPYGVLLLGIDDGKKLEEPIEGVETEEARQSAVERKLLYLRPFKSYSAKIAEYERDVRNPRFGRPKFYNLEFGSNLGNYQSQESRSTATETMTHKVHWTRVIHITDNREDDDVAGVPRMQKDWNRLLDMRKVLGSSAEMFYKGGFPGYTFEADADADLDIESAKVQADAHFSGLQRYMAFQGIKAKSLAPQVADPAKALDSQLEAVAISRAVPKRVLMGSEQGELASAQDTRRWNGRLKARRENYLSPMLIRPFIDRLISIGVLPFVESYLVKWPDLDTQTDKEKADVAKSWAEALSKYVAGDVEAIVTPEDFLAFFGNLTVDEIQTILQGIKSAQGEIEEEVEEQTPALEGEEGQ